MTQGYHPAHWLPIVAPICPTTRLAHIFCTVANWKNDIRREHWTHYLQDALECDYQHAQMLLDGCEIESAEQPHIVPLTGVSIECIRSERLIETDGVDILVENLRYLSEDLQHGQKKILAGYLGIHPATLSKWLSGEQRPRKEHITAIQQYFELTSETDIEKVSLFLALRPMTIGELRTWLHVQIDALDKTVLEALFPAFERLLKTW